MLQGKRVVVVGGAGLLGRAFCRNLTENGATVVVADLALDAASQLAEALNQAGGIAHAAQVDIASEQSVEALIAGVHGSAGRVDAVVVSAYPRNDRYGRRLDEVRHADFCENLSLHLGGYFLVAQKFGEYFQREGGGNIVLLGSIYGSMAPRFDIYDGTSMTMPVEYAAIKGGVIHLVRYLAQWFKGSGVRVNCLSPGGIRDRQPQQFVEAYAVHTGGAGMLAPDDVAGALAFLLSDASRHVTGQNLIVDDGFSL